MTRVPQLAALFGLGLGLVGCAADEAADDLPPTLEITSPERGTTADGDQVTVTGRVHDDRKVASVSVNGTEVTPNADGTFAVTLPIAAGIELIETHAIDSGGHDVRDVRAVMAGTLAPSDGTLAAPLGARLGPDALRSVGTAIGAAASAIDFTAVAQGLNPVYNNTGCLGARIDITSVGVGAIDVDLTPKAGSLATGVVIDNVVVRLHANFKVACIGGSTDITVRATRARLNGDLGLTVSGGKLAAALPNATVALDGFSVDVGGVPGAIESLLRGEARKAAENALTKVVRDKVPPLANTALAGLIAKPYSASILGRDTRVMIAPSQVSLTTDGLFVAVDTKLAVAGGEGGMFVSSPSPLSSSLMPSAGLGVAIADDAVNQLFAGLWAARALDQELSIADVPALAILLDDDARSVLVDFSLPPTVTGDVGNLELAIGDAMISVRDQGGTEIQKIAMSLQTTLTAGPTQTGTITLTVGAPTIKAQILTQTEAINVPMTDDQFEGLITGVWGLIGPMASSALENLPMPSVAGVSLGAPSVVGRDGYVVADVPLD